MGHEFTQHFDMMILLPLVIITHGECENPACLEQHWRLTLGFLFWSIEIWG